MFFLLTLAIMKSTKLQIYRQILTCSKMIFCSRSSNYLELFWIFVVVFTIFVIAYIYLKCFGKKPNEGEINKHLKKAQYKSLRFSSEGLESQTQPGPQDVDSQDCTYLTPVSKDKANSDICHSYENVEIIQETKTAKSLQTCKWVKFHSWCWTSKCL